MGDETAGEEYGSAWAKCERAIGRSSEKIVTLEREILKLRRALVEQKDVIESTKIKNPGIALRLYDLEQRQKYMVWICGAVIAVLELVLRGTELWLHK